MRIERPANGTMVELTARKDRYWRARRIVAGWRLEFRDEQDRGWTSAGVFKNLHDCVRQSEQG